MSDAEGDGSRTSLTSRVRVAHALPLVPLFLVSLLATDAISDNSFLWHIRSGDLQRSVGHVLSVDAFSFTELGIEWRTQSWLAELLYGGLETVFPGSLLWANWLVLIAGLLTVLFVGTAVYRSTQSPLSVGAVLMVVVWLIGPFLQPRPVVFSFVLLSALVVVLQNRSRALWVVVPIVWIWAAVHGSWVIGGMLVLLEWIRTGDRRLLRAGIAALLVTLVTPHGIGVWLIVFDFLGARDALAFISEWQVPDFGNPVQMPYVLVLFGVIIAAVRGKLTMRDLVVVLPFMLLGMTTRRTVVPVTIILAPWAALAVPALAIPRSKGGQMITVSVVAVMFAASLSPMAGATGELDTDRFPSTEVTDRLVGTNPFHDAGVGGYLIFTEWPDRLVWIDDRAELHGFERFSELRRSIDGAYEEVFDRYGFNAALVKPDWPLTDRLLRGGWTVDLETPEFVVLLP